MSTRRPHARAVTRRTALLTGAAIAAAHATRTAAQPAKPAPVPPLVQGYADPLSSAAGETVRLHTSSAAAAFDVEVARLGAKRDVVSSQKGVQGTAQPAPRAPASHGCRWPAATSLTVDPGWRSGYYQVT